MKKTITLILCMLSLEIISHGQNFEWAKSMGGSQNETGNSIAVDKWGNVYTTGNFEGTVDFDPGQGVSYLTSVGNNDIFVCKFDASGNFIWARSMGGINEDKGNGIAIDSLGYIYITGFFTGTADFDPSSATYNLTVAGTGYYADIFVSKLDSAGSFVWAKSMGSSGEDEGLSIALDHQGNIHTTGYYSGDCDFDPGTGTSILSSEDGSNDIFVSKLDNNGNFIWAKSMGGIFFDRGYAIAVDDSSNVYTTGAFISYADFDPGPDTLILHTQSSAIDIFVSKLDASGNFVWAKELGGANDSRGYAIAIDRQGNVLTTGYYRGTGDFDPGPNTTNLTASGSLGATDVFISKLDAAGNFVFAKSIGSSGADQGAAITTDTLGNIYTSGYFNDIVDFDPGAGVRNLPSAGYGDIFVSKLDTAGNFLWARNMGGSGDDRSTAITIDQSGNVYTTGYFNGNSDFDPGNAAYYLISAGAADVFVSKLAPCYVDASVSIINNTIKAIDTTADHYQWINCDNKQAIAGATSNFFSPTANGNYAVVVTSGNCTDTSMCVTLTYTSTRDISIIDAWSVFPNPATNQLTIEIKEEGNLTLFNTLGQVEWKTSMVNGKQTINISGLSAGNYILQYQTKHGTGMKRIVKN